MTARKPIDVSKQNTSERIEALLDHPCFVISPFYKRYDCGSRVSELEDYLLDTFLSDYAEKLSRILLSLIASKPFYLELTEINPFHKKNFYGYRPYTDLSMLTLSEIAVLVKKIIKDGGTQMNVLLLEEQVLMTIEDEFSVTVYAKTDHDVFRDIKWLTQNNGLYTFSAIRD